MADAVVGSLAPSNDEVTLKMEWLPCQMEKKQLTRQDICTLVVMFVGVTYHLVVPYGLLLLPAGGVIYSSSNP